MLVSELESDGERLVLVVTEPVAACELAAGDAVKDPDVDAHVLAETLADERSEGVSVDD